MTSISILLTVHNRKDKTLSTLSHIFLQEGLDDKFSIELFVVDDGSSDGTSPAIHSLYPQVNLLQGNGQLFWNGGMRVAFGKALDHKFDFLLWLNDDTILFPDAINKLINTSVQSGNKSIIVGSLQDPINGQLTYGGLSRKHSRRRLNFSLVEPSEIPIEVETMHGNCVLIPQAVALAVGNLDPAFTHGIGDYDYGLRAHNLGYKIILAPGYYGKSEKNSLREIWNDQSLPFTIRWKNLVSIQGLPPREWAIFAKRYAGFFWWVYWVSPYIRTIFSSLCRRIKR